VRFVIEGDVFRRLPTICIGVVVAEGLDNSHPVEEINLLLKESIEDTRARFQGINVKECPAIACYRDAFRSLGYNPNKFPCSVEALTSRIAKGGEPPDINAVVNMVNAVSLKYTLPMGAHDMDSIAGDIAVRFSKEGEPFTPLGEIEPESVPAGELVYADDREIRTRRWIWRQNDRGKVTQASRNVFFPIDGFTDVNLDAVRSAMSDLSALIEKFFSVPTHRYLLDQVNPNVEV
jgi:DNA/RNA-binding domain of Phe-tRNA-synthetase-like protein